MSRRVYGVPMVAAALALIAASKAAPVIDEPHRTRAPIAEPDLPMLGRRNKSDRRRSPRWGKA